MNLERIRHAINLRVCICMHYRHVYLVIICMRGPLCACMRHSRSIVVPFLKQRTTFSQLLLLYAIRRPSSTRLLDYYRSRLRSIAQIMVLPIRCLRPIGLYKSNRLCRVWRNDNRPDETNKVPKNSFLFMRIFLSFRSIRFSNENIS